MTSLCSFHIAVYTLHTVIENMRLALASVDYQKNYYILLFSEIFIIILFDNLLAGGLISVM